MADLDRLSLNQWTTRRWSLPEAVAGCVRAGVPAIGVWRDKLHEVGVADAVARVHDAGLRVSSLCRGGGFTADGYAAALADNRAALDEAAALGAACLPLVVGGLPAGSRDLDGARERVADALAELVPYAVACGVPLALEPLHPMYAADRAVLSTLAQALDLAEGFPPSAVGVVVDAFHVWWDPDLAAQLARAQGRVLSYQVSDWVLPMPRDPLLARGMMGDGYVDFAALGRLVALTGYTGDVEVEIFNEDVWATPGDTVLATAAARYAALVAPALTAPAAAPPASA